MKNIIEVKAYYADTDCYGVVWHGAYLRWLEQGRVELSNMCGIDFKELYNQNILIPVVDMHVRYKKSARVEDVLIIETELKEIKNTRIIFSQTIKDKNTDAVYIQATITVVAIDKDGGLFRKIPEYVEERYSRALKTCAVC